MIYGPCVHLRADRVKTAHDFRRDTVAPESDGIEHAVVFIIEIGQPAIGISVNQNLRMSYFHLFQQFQMKADEREASAHVAAQQFRDGRLGKLNGIDFQFNQMEQRRIFFIRQFQHLPECGNRSPGKTLRLPASEVILPQFAERHGGNFPPPVRGLVNRRIMAYDNFPVRRPVQVIFYPVAPDPDCRLERRQSILRIFFRESAMPANLNLVHFFLSVNDSFRAYYASMSSKDNHNYK